MRYRKSRKSVLYSVNNREPHKEKVADKFELYIKWPVDRINNAITKEQILVASLKNSLRELEVFSSELSKLWKESKELTDQKYKTFISIMHHKSQLKKYDDYQRASLFGRWFKSKLIYEPFVYEMMREELMLYEHESKRLASNIECLNANIANKRATIEKCEVTSDDYRNKQNSVNKRKENAALRLSALIKARNHVQKKEETVQKREKAVVNEISKYKAYAAAYFDKSRKLAEFVKNEMHNQEEIIEGCPYCGCILDETPHADHIYPIVKGGLSVKENMVYICIRCNLRKSGMTLREFIIKADLNRKFVETNLERLGKKF